MADFSTTVVTAVNQVVQVNSSVPGSYDSVARLGLGVFSIAEYRAGGTVSDTVAFASAAAACKAAGGGEVYVPAGSYSITGMALADADNVKFNGVGKASKVSMDGSTDGAIFRFQNCNNVRVENLWLHGNLVASTDGLAGSAIYWDNTSGSAAVEGFTVRHCFFDNFKGGAWVRVQQSAAFTMSRVRILHNTFWGGGDRDSTAIGTAAAQFACRSALTSTIEDVLCEGNTCEASEVKQGLSCVSTAASGGFAKIRYIGNTVVNAGQTNSAAGAYALAIYGGANGATATDCVVSGNTLVNPYTCGLYTVNNRGLSITGNTVSGQEDTDDASLARGGIVAGDSSGVTISGNTLRDCVNAIYASNNVDTGSPSQVGVSITGNTVVGGTRGIVLRYKNTSGYTITGNTVSVTTEGIVLKRTTDTNTADDLICSNNTVTANASAVSVFQGIGGSGKDLYGARWTIEGNVVNCGGMASATAYPLGNVTAAGPSGKLRGNIAYNTGNIGFQLRNLRMDVVDNTADTCGTSGNAATGGFASRDAQGDWSGNKVLNLPSSAFVIQSSAGEDLGLDTPTWSGGNGQTVQTQSPTSGQQWGWVCTGGTTWKAFGTLA